MLRLLIFVIVSFKTNVGITISINYKTSLFYLKFQIKLVTNGTNIDALWYSSVKLQS